MPPGQDTRRVRLRNLREPWVVLELPPVDSAETAVKVAIAAAVK